MQAYASHKMKDIYDVNQLDLIKVASAFGLDVPPRVNLSKRCNFRREGLWPDDKEAQSG